VETLPALFRRIFDGGFWENPYIAMNIPDVLNFKMSLKVYIRTFGCQMNMHDSEKMAGILLREGHSLINSPKDADIIIFNTCSIRQKAEQKFKSELGKTKLLKKKRGFLKIAVAGCIAQQQGRGILKESPFVNYILGPQNIHMIKDIVVSDNTIVSTEDNEDIEYSDFPVKRADNIKAWVSIMYGCNNFCSYCIVPYTRGREKSRPAVDIYKEVSQLASEGFKEITLLGQNVNSYNSDCDFAGLLKKIDTIDGIERIRFVTSHPRDLSDNLIGCIKELPKVCEHIHLPLQSGSNRILKLMNRGYSFEDYMEKIERLRKEVPEIAITTDIIVGFPSETEKDHTSTIDAINEIEFDGIFAFKFSPRPGTKASEMEDEIPDAIKSQRLTEVLKLQDEITLKKKNMLLEGTLQEVLVEGKSKTDDYKLTGRTRSNKIVNFVGDNSVIGQLTNIKIIKAGQHSLEGKLM
jgi:tRNA-2-methylthio-N6-dimethylallyladenosine synthase